MRNVSPVATVDDYLKAAPAPVRAKLKQLRTMIKALAPDAEEIILYGMPFYKRDGARIGFAAFKDHIGFFPGAVVRQFADELSGYETARGSVRFANDKPLPVTLIKTLIAASLRRKAGRAKSAKKSVRKS